MPFSAQIRERLNHVLDPELGASIVELGMVGEISVAGDGRATVNVALTTIGCPLKSQIERDVREAVLLIDGVTGVELVMGVLDAPARANLMQRARAMAQERAPAPRFRFKLRCS